MGLSDIGNNDKDVINSIIKTEEIVEICKLFFLTITSIVFLHGETAIIRPF